MSINGSNSTIVFTSSSREVLAILTLLCSEFAQKRSRLDSLLENSKYVPELGYNGQSEVKTQKNKRAKPMPHTGQLHIIIYMQILMYYHFEIFGRTKLVFTYVVYGVSNTVPSKLHNMRQSCNTVPLYPVTLFNCVFDFYYRRRFMSASLYCVEERWSTDLKHQETLGKKINL